MTFTKREQAKKMNIVVPYIIYPPSVMFSLGEKDDDLALSLAGYMTELSPEVMPRLEDMDAGKTWVYDNGFTLIRMHVVPNSPDELGVLQHEIAHAVFRLMRYIGMPLGVKSEEAYTYLIEYLTREVLKQIRSI